MTPAHPVLPLSFFLRWYVSGTAKLRNLPLFRLHDMMEGLDAPLLAQDGAGHMAMALDEEDDVELREGEEVGSKGPVC